MSKQQSIIRCPGCNEIFTNSDVKNLKKNQGVCNWCIGNNRYRCSGYSYCERLDFSDWINRLWHDSDTIRPGLRNYTHLFWFNE